MSAYRIKITETTTQIGTADYMIQADTAEAAAAILSVAYHKTQATGGIVMTLPDGTQEDYNPDVVVQAQVSFALLDASGSVLREITRAELSRSLN